MKTFVKVVSGSEGTHAGANIGKVFEVKDSSPGWYSLVKEQYGVLEGGTLHKDDCEVVKTEFTKSDLKDWMVVIFRNGSKRLVNASQGYLMGEDCHDGLSSLNEDLTCKYSEDRDIMEVHNAMMFNTNQREEQYFHEGTLLWKREEKSPTQIKIEEIEKKQRDLADELKQLQEEL